MADRRQRCRTEGAIVRPIERATRQQATRRRIAAQRLAYAQILRSYLRRRGEFLYDIETYEATPAGAARRFDARVVSMVRLESGQTVSVTADLRNAHGATCDEPFSKIDAAIQEWVKDRTRLT
jgi:hypothetical protein